MNLDNDSDNKKYVFQMKFNLVTVTMSFQNKAESFNKCYPARVSSLMNHLLGQTDVVARVSSHSAKAEESFPRSPGVLEAP